MGREVKVGLGGGPIGASYDFSSNKVSGNIGPQKFSKSPQNNHSAIEVFSVGFTLGVGLNISFTINETNKTVSSVPLNGLTRRDATSVYRECRQLAMGRLRSYATQRRPLIRAGR